MDSPRNFSSCATKTCLNESIASLAEVMNNYPVRIVTFIDEPYVNPCFELYPTIKCPSPGFEAEYIHTVINGMLKLPIQWIKVNSSVEMKEMVDNRKADIAGSSLPMSSLYIKSWGFPPPNYLYDNIALIVREVDTGRQKFFGLLADFTWDLWASIIAISLSLFFARWASKRLQKMKDVDDNVPLKIYMQITHFFRANLCYSIWFVLLSFMLNFYSNLIAVDLIRPNTMKTIPFTSMKDLGEKLIANKCKLAIMKHYKSGYDFNLIINPNTSTKLWAPLFVKAYQVNKPILVENRDEMVNLVKNSSCVIGLDYGSMDTWYLTRHCYVRVYTDSEEIPLLGYTFYTRREEIKEAMSRVMSSSSFQMYPTSYLKHKYFSYLTPPVCRSSNDLKKIDVTLDLPKVQDCFYVLAIGLIIALLAAVGKTGLNLVNKK